MVELSSWRGGLNVVTAADGAPRLWLSADGELCDVLGPQTSSSSDDSLADTSDLLLFAAEWLYCVAQTDGPTRYADIHPDIRASLYEFIPSAIALSDDDEVAFILS
jgi:hypothetical protein